MAFAMTDNLTTSKRDVLAGHAAWRDELVFRLRIEGASPEAIGDILLEVDTHVRDTGESPEEAFGSAETYAPVRAVGARRVRMTDGAEVLEIVGTVAGVALTVWSMWLLVNGGHLPFMLRPWVGLALGMAILWIVLRPKLDDLVRHPSSGQPIGDGQMTRELRMQLGMITYVVLLYMLTVIIAAFF
jgi:hypothetical protein